MSKINEVMKTRNEHGKLIKAVISKLGYSGRLTKDEEEELLDTLKNVVNHGASIGFGGFIYYSDTIEFARKNQNSIIKLLEEEAESFGEEVAEMVFNFGDFRKSPPDTDDKRDVYRFLSGAKCKETKIPNLMAWFALEEVARFFEED